MAEIVEELVFYEEFLTGSTQWEALKEVARLRYVPSRVLSAVDERSDFWDLTVDETHSYLANGFMSHNTGKSFCLVNAAVQAKRQGYTPYVASLEQSVEEFEDRIDAFASGVGYGKLQRGELIPAEIDRLNSAQDRLAELGPLYVESPPRGERTVVSIVNRARQLGADYLIIDQLSWMDTRKDYRERRDQYKELIYDLKEEIGRASAGQLPCFMAVQFNRASGPKGRGGLDNIANAADVEQTVDIAYGLYRNDEMRANDSMVLDIMGSRRTDTEAFLLGWYLERESSIFFRRTYEEEG